MSQGPVPFPYCDLYKRAHSERTNEVYLPMNGLNTDRLPVQAEAHQSWPPKRETDKLTKREKQSKKKKKTNYTVIHTIVAEKYKEKLLMLELNHHTLDHIELVKYNHSDMFSDK